LRAPEDNFLDLAECLFGTVDPRDGSHCSDLRSRVSFSLFTALGSPESFQQHTVLAQPHPEYLPCYVAQPEAKNNNRLPPQQPVH